MIDSIIFKVTIHSTEDEDKVNKSLNFILNDLYNLKYSIRREFEGYYGNKIIIIERKISKSSECIKFMDFFVSNINIEDIKLVRSEINKRIDGNLNFYLRFDKQEAFMNKLKLTNKEDAIFVKIKLKTYPKSVHAASLLLEEFLDKKRIY